MTWNETHERMRIIHEVEEVSAADMTGAIPWRDEWSAYFNGPNALVAALRSRWNHMTEVQLDRTNNEDEVAATLARLRASQAGILAILKAAGFDAPRVLRLSGPAKRVEERPARARGHFRLLRGPVLPTTNPTAR
jgi:hypothetical protein